MISSEKSVTLEFHLKVVLTSLAPTSLLADLCFWPWHLDILFFFIIIFICYLYFVHAWHLEVQSGVVRSHPDLVPFLFCENILYTTKHVFGFNVLLYTLDPCSL